MTCNDKNQSAISEVRDQLFLDTADGIRLNIVTGNLGLNRPIIGIEDDEWRAIAKAIALQPKLVRNAFFRVLEICLGPQFARIGTLAAVSDINDISVTAVEGANFVQVGTMVIDPTLPTEETVRYCFFHPVTGNVQIEQPLVFPHAVIPPGESWLAADAAAGAVSLVLRDSSLLPTVGFPYPVMVGNGTLQEEVVQVIANTVGINTLTLAIGTLFDHKGPETLYVRTVLATTTVKTSDGDTIGGVAPNMTMTDASAIFSADDVGRYITIVGATPVANNGTFPITIFGGATTVTYTNAAGVAAVFTGTWTVTNEVPAGRTFISVAANTSRRFPPTGFLRIGAGTANEEVVEYDENIAADNVFALVGILANLHIVNETVELVTSGDIVAVAQLVEYGTHWSVKETDPKNVQILLPENTTSLRMLDASWLHGAVPPAVATTTTSFIGPSVLPTDRSIEVTSVVGFPDEGSMIFIGAVKTFYTLRISSTDVTATLAVAANIGDTQLSYQLSDLALGDFPKPIAPYRISIGGGAEFAYVTDVDYAAKKLILFAPLVAAHILGTSVACRNQLILSEPFTVGLASPIAVSLYRVPYAAAPILEDGNYRDLAGNIITDHFAGPYIFDRTQRAVSSTSVLLSAIIPPTLRVAVSQTAGRTNLEVTNGAAVWAASPFSPFQAKIGTGTGNEETRTVIDRTLKRDCAATVIGPTLAGITTMFYTLTGPSQFPESNGIAPAGYRVIIGAGTGNEEIATVLSNDTFLAKFVFVSPLVNPHANLETIALLNDVITTDQLTQPHAGPSVPPAVAALGQTISPLIEEITVAAALTSFPATGYIWLNFGNERVNARAQLTAAAGTLLTLVSTSAFPAANYPYPIIVGDGRSNEEVAFVTNNNTGLNQLTIASAIVFAHVAGEYVQYTAGSPEVVQYTAKAAGPDRLLFSPSIVMASTHYIGERAILSPGLAESDIYGGSFSFKLPADPAACAAFLVELIRAAGVQVTFVTV